MPKLSEELRALGHLKDRLDAANAVKKQAEKEHKRHQWDCFRLMEDEGTESSRVDGVTYSPVSKPYATVQDRAAFVAWAQENSDELIEYKEREALINALVRERLDDGRPMPPGLGSYDREYISQTVKS